MDDTLNFELTNDDPAEIKRVLDHYLQAMRRILAQIEKDEEIIERNNAQTRFILDQLRNEMQKAA